MLSLTDPKSNNPVLASLQIKTSEKIISVKENGSADSNFILTHLIKQIFYEKNKILLIGLHNTLDHYQNVGKKLGYDFKKSIDDHQAGIIEPLDDLTQKIIEDDVYENKEELVKCLFGEIQSQIALLSESTTQQIYLIVDDLSHLLDLGVDIAHIISFINYCNSLVDTENVAVVINTHVCNKIDEIISNTLQYVSDVHIEVASLKTGRSTDVTGVINVSRDGGTNHYQYKTFDRGVKTFHPGQAIFNMYK
ncbi:unnamed protein product [Brassicogethes aeneus]|uniref:Elongator complex protein 6 n=1 Tax=Brassicogethes aeneus TaxID=1431903 RepID=A0A9P0BG96_BRAAE|nr:unnamed protein product [Brassicogethes aeneus]